MNGFYSCSTNYNERKAYLYINPESESSTQITLDFYDEYDNDDTTLFFSDDYTGINEFYIYGMNNIKTNLIYIIILILIISYIQWNENSFDIYSKENLGFNYILEEPTITLSKDYKYYDELNNKSIPFIDFGKITSDLVFNVPNS